MPRAERCRVEGCEFPIYLTNERLCLDHVLHPDRIPEGSVPSSVFDTLHDIAWLNGGGSPDALERPDPDEPAADVPTTPSRSASRARSTPKE